MITGVSDNQKMFEQMFQATFQSPLLSLQRQTVFDIGGICQFCQ